MEALFSQVLKMSLTASYVILAVLVARLLLKKAPRKYSYLLWSAVGFRLCCPVSFQWFFSLFSLQPFLESLVPETQANALPSLPLDAAVSFPNSSVDSVFTGSPVPDSLLTAVKQESGTVLWPWIGILLWLTGITVMLIYAVFSYAGLSRQMRTAVLLEGRVWQSDKVRSPFILGFFRPKIYLPFGLEEEAQRYILAHEQYHLRRMDHLIKPAAFFLLTLHWFNPLCWLAFSLMARDMEMSCDEKVLSQGENIRKVYSTSLLSFAANRRFPAPSPLTFGEVSVTLRIQNVLNWKKPRLWMTLAAAALSLFTLAACASDSSGLSKDSVKGQNLWGKEYQVEKIVYESGQYSFGYTENTAPQYRLSKDGCLSVLGDSLQEGASSEWLMLGAFFETHLTQDNFDSCFMENHAGIWGEECLPSKLREENQAAWRLDCIGTPETFYYLLQQQDGSVYLSYGYPEQPSIRWLFRLTATEAGASACLYLNPLSSLTAGAGFQYSWEENCFTITYKDSGQILFRQTLDGLNWQPFPYTSETWQELFVPENWAPDISEYWSPLFLPLSEQYSLLNMDGFLWLMEWKTNPQMGRYVWSVYTLEPAGVSEKDSENEEGPTDFQPDPLDAALTSAILEQFQNTLPTGLLPCESHSVLDIKTISATPQVGQKENKRQITVYAVVLYQEFSYSEGRLTAVGGSHTPTAITFDVTGNETYSLTEYWIPRDGALYASDIQEKFPQNLWEQALDTQAYLVTQMQDCYETAVNYWQIDTNAIAENLFEQIMASPAFSSNPGDYIAAHPSEYQELIYYGDNTLRYLFSHFLKGDETGLKGHLMRQVMDQLVGKERLNISADTGQEYFNQWRRKAEDAWEKYGSSYMVENAPKAWLLLQMTGK